MEKMMLLPFILILVIGVVTHYLLPIIRHDIWIEYDGANNCTVKIRRYGRYGRENIHEYSFSRGLEHWQYEFKLANKVNIEIVLSVIIMIIFFYRFKEMGHPLAIIVLVLMFVFMFLMEPVFAYFYLVHEENS